MIRFRLLAFAIVTSTFVPAVAFANEEAAVCAPGWESAVFAAHRGSVVRITDGEGWGAGFIWRSPRTVVTAMHVVEHGSSLDIRFDDGSTGHAHIVAGNRATDVAILELDGDAPALAPLEFGDPSTLPLGAPVIAIGHPFARENDDARDQGLHTWSISRGVLSARNEHEIQVDAPLNPGNSGGPLLDCSGRVIGVASHVSGSLGFARSPREVLLLDHNHVLPHVRVVPTLGMELGLSTRSAHSTLYGPLFEVDFKFFERIHVKLRATGLLGVASTVRADRVVTSRTGGDVDAGVGYGFRLPRLLLRLLVVPQVGLAAFSGRENAITVTNGKLADSSTTSSQVRLTPGLSLANSWLVFDYKMELDTGAFADSAHLFSASLVLF